MTLRFIPRRGVLRYFRMSFLKVFPSYFYLASPNGDSRFNSKSRQHLQGIFVSHPTLIPFPIGRQSIQILGMYAPSFNGFLLFFFVIKRLLWGRPFNYLLSPAVKIKRHFLQFGAQIFFLAFNIGIAGNEGPVTQGQNHQQQHRFFEMFLNHFYSFWRRITKYPKNEAKNKTAKIVVGPRYINARNGSLSREEKTQKTLEEKTKAMSRATIRSSRFLTILSFPPGGSVPQDQSKGLSVAVKWFLVSRGQLSRVFLEKAG